ncbi:hypothetical protein Daura_38600 [Dactylosporangium aurantiacum]|uniref:Uncharacterized protein n=1 Tax=Dactylosporangium aurantiacum TaxID=35754 RepID=A0A9Q9MHD4_9ACTN|nr:hypothetical protein [Dactylosporangium aurantiacum]MDG6101667.1 hypothetical protein [Dactylosporangium aurantiacum]UWZ52511.1 hypothetical protein Daura_38600 [Dactylosporangium aurantiacum]
MSGPTTTGAPAATGGSGGGDSGGGGSGARLLRHERLSAALALRGDDAVAALVDGDARPGAAGIGGRTATLDVAGVPVFVKQVPVTALDLRHPHSTANLFGLPMCYQYGVGSTG